MSEEMENLIQQWLDNSIESGDEQKLNNWLKESPQHMQHFVEANVRDQMLRDAAKGIFLTDEVQSKVSRTAKSARLRRSRLLAFASCLAACLMIVIGLVCWPEAVVQLPFASVAAVHENNAKLKAGDRIGAETIQFETGFVRLFFDDGVEVTLQGPVRYDLLSLGRTRLVNGLLTAIVPPGAEGFEVETSHADIVDLGTVFGVELGDDGLAKVSVFDGEVEVKTKNDGQRKLVQEGEAVRIQTDGVSEPAEFETKSFEKIWPAASGVAGSTGAFQFAPPWPRPMGLVKSDSKIFVLPEGLAQKLEEPLSLNITTAGEFRVAADLTTSQLPAGTQVKSYLLQFSPETASQRRPGPPPRRSDPNELKRIVGEITFDRPILGLIVLGDDLRATDRLFSKRGGQVPQKGRALELFGSPRDDVVSLSDDLRTVKLDVAAFSVFSDQVRVIVDQQLPE